MFEFKTEVTLDDEEICCLIQALTHESAEVIKELNSDSFYKDCDEGNEMYSSLCNYKELCDELAERFIGITDEMYNAQESKSEEHEGNIITFERK